MANLTAAILNGVVSVIGACDSSDPSSLDVILNINGGVENHEQSSLFMIT